MDIAVVGGGIAGMATALYLAKDGHHVTIFERDAAPIPPSSAEAFEWDRRGAPQVRHAHAMLARLRNLLRDDHPEVYAALLDTGATEMKLYEEMPGYDPDTGVAGPDEEVVMIACRRATLEWVMRTVLSDVDGVDFRRGVEVSGLVVEHTPDPTVRGLRLTDAPDVAADLVVLADGRRSNVRPWLGDAGIELPDDVEEPAGIVYFSRFYRLHDGLDFPTTGLVADDLGFVFYAAFCGDNRHFALALSANDDDADLRKAFGRTEGFEAVVEQLPQLSAWVASGTPVTDVFPMAGLANRRRHFVTDGEPVVRGLHAVGDAHVCTNPAYGRGLALATWQAKLLAEPIAAHPDDLRHQSLAFCSSIDAQIAPWFDIAVVMDGMRRQAREQIAAGEPAAESPMAGIRAAAEADPEVWRSFWRAMNLLEPPGTLMAPEFLDRVAAATEALAGIAEPEPNAPEVLDRAGLLEAIAAADRT